MPSMQKITIPHIADHFQFSGPRSSSEVNLLIEVPHGATRASDFHDLASRLQGVLPEDLIHFFFVNTDVGAPEVALYLAERLVESNEAMNVEVIQSRIPRTFIDVNRKIDVDLESYREGRVTPGIPDWSQGEEDLKLLKELYFAYQDLVATAKARLASDGLMLFLHTFSPRTVGVTVTENIVSDLHGAYEPEQYEQWPLRPEVEIIDRDMEGISYTSEALKSSLRRELATIDLKAEENTTYPLHPSTMAYHNALDLKGRALCLEIRRDLLADPFKPFEENDVSLELVARIGEPILRALLEGGR